MPTTLSFDQLHARALTRARAARLACVEMGPTWWTVPSQDTRPGEWRHVHQLPGGALTCDCPGNRSYGCCTHSATVELALGDRLPRLRLPAGATAPPDPEAARLCPQCRAAPRRHETGLCRECEIDAMFAS